MKVLIVYATTEGQTRKIARYLSNSMQDRGHTVELFDCSTPEGKPDPSNFDAVLLAASVHDKRYQAAFYHYVSENLEALQQKPVALVSVSLAITLAGGEAEAQSYVDDFLAETGLKVDRVHLAEGAIRYFEYSGSEANTIHVVVFKGQRKMPERDGNPEYTDWAALDAFAASFLEVSRK